MQHGISCLVARIIISFWESEQCMLAYTAAFCIAGIFLFHYNKISLAWLIMQFLAHYYLTAISLN